jgi:hypothetical protein
VMNITTNTPDWIKDHIKERAANRHSRRRRKTPFRKCRSNRSGHRNRNFVPPSVKARWDAKLRMIKVLISIFPITKINVEDVKAKSKTGDKRWNKSFSPLEFGKTYFHQTIINNYKDIQLENVCGFETKQHRDERYFFKSFDKLANTWSAHNVDSHSLAEMILDCEVEPYKNILICRFLEFHRRQLHVMVPSTGGIRKQYGTTVSMGYPRGMVCKYIENNNSKHKSKYRGHLFYLGGCSISRNKKVERRVSIYTFSGKRVSQEIKIQNLKMLYAAKFIITGTKQ